MSRLTGLDAAIGIVEELHRLEEGPASEVRETYKLLGLPEETLEKSVMISRLKHYMMLGLAWWRSWVVLKADSGSSKS